MSSWIPWSSYLLQRCDGVCTPTPNPTPGIEAPTHQPLLPKFDAIGGRLALWSGFWPSRRRMKPRARANPEQGCSSVVVPRHLCPDPRGGYAASRKIGGWKVTSNEANERLRDTRRTGNILGNVYANALAYDSIDLVNSIAAGAIGSGNTLSSGSLHFAFLMKNTKTTAISIICVNGSLGGQATTYKCSAVGSPQILLTPITYKV